MQWPNASEVNRKYMEENDNFLTTRKTNKVVGL